MIHMTDIKKLVNEGVPKRSSKHMVNTDGDKLVFTSSDYKDGSVSLPLAQVKAEIKTIDLCKQLVKGVAFRQGMTKWKSAHFNLAERTFALLKSL